MWGIDWEHFLLRLGRGLYTNSMRYLVAAGALFLIFYVWKRNAWSHRKIQPRAPEPARIRREVLWSFSSIGVFSLIGALAGLMRGHMRLYPDIASRGWGYLLLSIVLLILWHDAWFYWTHRLLHTRWMFRRFHAVHHRSIDPTPWAAFSFHPVEAAIQVAFIYIAVFVVPLHRAAVLTMVLYQMLLNTLGHLGYELFPRGFVHGRLTRWHNTATHHNLHHAKATGNYGLYFNLWDRWMGTNHPDYERTFDEVKGRTPLRKAS